MKSAKPGALDFLWAVAREAWDVFREHREAKRAAPKRPAPHLDSIPTEARKREDEIDAEAVRSRRNEPATLWDEARKQREEN